MKSNEKHLIDLYKDYLKHYRSIKHMAQAHAMDESDLKILLESGKSLLSKQEK